LHSNPGESCTQPSPYLKEKPALEFAFPSSLNQGNRHDRSRNRLDNDPDLDKLEIRISGRPDPEDGYIKVLS